MRCKKPQPVEMTTEEVESLLDKAGSVLSSEEITKLRSMIETLQYLTHELDKKRVSVQRLKEMLFGATTEKTSRLKLQALLEQQSRSKGTSNGKNGSADSKTHSHPLKATGKKKGHGRLGADAYRGAGHEHIAHPTIKPKDPCPKCDKGRLYQ